MREFGLCSALILSACGEELPRSDASDATIPASDDATVTTPTTSPDAALIDAGTPSTEDAGARPDSGVPCDFCYPDAGVPDPNQICAADDQPCSVSHDATEICVPGGAFTMGTDQPPCPGRQSRGYCEAQSHVVNISAVLLDRVEVTNLDYALCVSTSSCSEPLEGIRFYNDPAKALFPVVGVTHTQATEYCAWRGKRLPTEAEWEKAARGTIGLVYAWAGEPSCEIAALCGGEFSDSGPQSEVGAHPQDAGAYGVLDLGGSVAEWVADVYDEYAYLRTEGPPPFCDPLITDRWFGEEDHRVVRGCSYLCGPISEGGSHRATYRSYESRDRASETVGFRCARSGN
jgi:formylglycine-generating enzyme required for sulfatase activity